MTAYEKKITDKCHRVDGKKRRDRAGGGTARAYRAAKRGARAKIDKLG